MTGVVIDCHGANAEFHFHMAFWHFLLSEEHTVALLRPDVATAKEYVRCVYKVRCSPIHTQRRAYSENTHPPAHTHPPTPTHTHTPTHPPTHTHPHTHTHTPTHTHTNTHNCCPGIRAQAAVAASRCGRPRRQPDVRVAAPKAAEDARLGPLTFPRLGACQGLCDNNRRCAAVEATAGAWTVRPVQHQAKQPSLHGARLQAVLLDVGRVRHSQARCRH
jgi:hypothetical protein